MLNEKIKNCTVCGEEIKNGGVNKINLEYSQNLTVDDKEEDICDDCATIFAEAFNSMKN